MSALGGKADIEATKRNFNLRLAQKLRQLADIRRDPPRLILRQALGCRLALRLIGKSPAAVLFSHDLTLSEGFKKIRQGFGLSLAQFDCDGGQVALDFGP
jgi:hypothetical protein